MIFLTTLHIVDFLKDDSQNSQYSHAIIPTMKNYKDHRP